MNYPEFVQELVNRFGEERGVLMALRAEVGFLRKYLEGQGDPKFAEEQQTMIADFLDRHPTE